MPSFAHQKMRPSQLLRRWSSEALPSRSSARSPNPSCVVLPQVSESVEGRFIHTTAGNFFFFSCLLINSTTRLLILVFLCFSLSSILRKGPASPIRSRLSHLLRIFLLLRYGLVKMIPLPDWIAAPTILGLSLRVLLGRGSNAMLFFPTTRYVFLDGCWISFFVSHFPHLRLVFNS